MAPYSPGAMAGDTIYVSGTLALDQDGQLVGKDDPRAQTRHILRAIEAVLETGGGHLSDIAYNMIFINRAADYAAVNEVYREFFPGAAPARFCIICELVKPEFLVEISSIALCTTMTQEGNYLRARAANSP
jgi:aminoacrylate peracid reductase